MTVVAVELPITVRIPHADPGKGFLGLPPTELGRGLLGQSHTVFIIEVVALGLESHVRRHFEDFERLHADISLLIRSLPSEVRLRLNYAMPPLPTTSWFVDSAKALEERRVKLEAMLQKLLLQPEIVYDSAERLWGFLDLHTAVTSAVSLLAATACGPWLHSLWESSAEGQGLVPLQHPSVEDALLQVIANTVGENWELADGKQQGSMILACEILERIFANGRDVVVRPERVLRRRVDVLVSLLLCACAAAPPEFGGSEEFDTADSKKGPLPHSRTVRAAAAAVLLAFARADRTTWQQALCAYLSASALRHLVSVVEAGQADAAEDMMPGETAGGVDTPARVVAELLLRGFDGPVLERFAEPDLGIERKQLLNSLFASQDFCARIGVGLLLARLLCGPDYAEAPKAELGLSALCGELGPRMKRLGGEAALRPLLLEEELWTWLSRLVASPHGMVSGFALVVVVHVARPSTALIARTPGMLEALAVLVQPESDETVRSLAASLLLATYRGEDKTIPADPALIAAVCGALALAAKQAVARQSDEQAALEAGTSEARSLYGMVASTQELASRACDGAAQLQAASEAWRNALVAADGALEAAEHVKAACVACLGSHQAYWTTAVSNLAVGEEALMGRSADPTPELRRRELELLHGREQIEQSTLRMEHLVQEKMDLTRQVSECNEEVQRWLAAARDAEACAEHGGAVEFAACGPRPGAVEEGSSVDACWQKHREAVQTLKALRAQVEQVDASLQELSVGLPALREATDAGAEGVRDLTVKADEARQRNATILSEWGKVVDVGVMCDAELDNFTRRLSEAWGALDSERSHRRSLRGSIQGLVASLVAWDGHLDSLEVMGLQGTDKDEESIQGRGPEQQRERW